MKRDDAGNNLISLVRGNERQAFHKALLAIETVQMEIPGLPQTRKIYFQGLPIELTEERLSNFKQLPQVNTSDSALVLSNHLGCVKFEGKHPNFRKPYCLA